ncbi:VWA domain-containing protein [Methanomethylovorans sp.]|uniref:VWA domain-containing protein n=1 Tax=Methanomethylovorans sp. TaxID=2758717 RepID=UPI00351BFF82
MKAQTRFMILLLILLSLSVSAMALTIDVYPLHIYNSAGDNVSVMVRVMDNSTPLANVSVNFTTNLGYLSSASTLTNASGYGQVFLTTNNSGTATLNVSSGSVSNTTPIFFSPLSPENIVISESKNPINAGNITTVRIAMLDQFGNVNDTAAMVLDITLADVFGSTVKETLIMRTPYTLTSIQASRNLTDDSIADIIITDLGIADQNVTLAINSTIAGNINISVSSSGVSSSKDIEVRPAAPSGIELWYNDEYTVNTTSIITARVYDIYDNPVANSLVQFSATAPVATVYNSPYEYNSLYLSNLNYITGIDGIAFSVFRADKRAGENAINIRVANSSINSSIAITGLADVTDNLFLTSSPASAYANNEDIYRLTGQAVDQFLNPIVPEGFPIKEQVTFYSGSSSIIVPLNREGKASTLVGPTPYIESVNISAIYRDSSGPTNVTNSTTLNFLSGTNISLAVYASPETLLVLGLNGNHESTIKTIAIDEWGHTLPGINLTINTSNATVGYLSMNGVNGTTINTTTNEFGRVTLQFFCTNVQGNTTIVVTAGNVSAITPITVKDDPFLSTYINVEPESLKSGDVVNVTTVVSLEGDLQITRPAANAVLVLDRSGSMDPDYYAGTPMDVVLVLDRSGSMTSDGLNPPQPMTNVKNGAKDFMDNLVSNSKVGLVSFSTTATTDKTLTLMNSYDNKTSIKAAISTLNPSGSTAMGDAMAAANNLLVNGRTDTKKVMVLLTDGVCNAGSDQECTNAISVAQTNDITVYTIGLGTNLDESLLQKIAFETNGQYYNAPTSADLDDVYNSIAQDICDYDISAIEYGTEGFTPYDYTASGSVTGSDVFIDTFEVNRTINDLKLQLDWTNNKNLNLELIAPDGTKYGMGNNTKGYYPNATARPSEYIWISPLSYTYPDYDVDSVPQGNWTVRVKGAGTGTENFRIKTYIDKKSATKLASHSFISSFDESRGDNAGLILYSFDSVTSNTSQTSYLRNDSTWTGYFTVDEDAIYKFNLSWEDSSKFGLSLYKGIELLNSSNSTTQNCNLSSPLYAGNTYHLEVSKYSGPQNDTEFNIYISSSALRDLIAAYYDSTTTPKYRKWKDQRWSSELSTNAVGGKPYFIVTASSPVKSEIIMGTLDHVNDFNVQIWNGSSWGSVSEFSVSADSASRKGFDIAYEQVSGDAMVAYMDMGIDDGIPRYRTWNGVSWSSAGAANAISSGSGDVGWVKMASDPFSDEILLITLDDSLDMRAQVWNGNSWGNSVSITNNAETYNYQCFDVIYEQQTGNALVVWTDGSSNTIKYRIWNGSSWSSENTISSFSSNSIYWIKMAADTNSNNVIMGIETGDYDIYVTSWNTTSWSLPIRVETSLSDYNRRTMDVAFERESGKGLVVWGDSSTVPKYRTWNGSWSSEASAFDLLDSSTRWVQLTPDPLSNDMFLITSDGSNDINIQKWDGTEWSIPAEVEVSSSYSYECFDLAFTPQNDSYTSTPVSWTEWRASVTSTLQNDSLSHLSNAIDTMTADGLTAIDEGMYKANEEFAPITGNSTMVIMTDGLDNAGYHSLMLEALEAKEKNTTIFTIGFGNNESEVDPVLSEVADLTGGEYYFAPNSSVLENIFKGIASQITNYSAEGPVLNIHIPRNYVTSYTVAKATYISGSSNGTVGNRTSFAIPTYPKMGNAEPVITTLSDRSVLTWQLPNLSPGEKWGVWYQMVVQGAGYVPIIMPQSNITYMDLNGTNITVYLPASGSASIGGSAAGIGSYSLGDLKMTTDKPVTSIDEPCELTLWVKDTTGNYSFAYVVLYTNLGYFNNGQNHINMTVVGSEKLDFSSVTAGNAYIRAYAYNVNNVTDTTECNGILVIRPKGTISID